MKSLIVAFYADGYIRHAVWGCKVILHRVSVLG